MNEQFKFWTYSELNLDSLSNQQLRLLADMSVTKLQDRTNKMCLLAENTKDWKAENVVTEVQNVRKLLNCSLVEAKHLRDAMQP